MTLPALLEFQKIAATGLREFATAAENPEGFALLLAETLHANGLQIVRLGVDDGLTRVEETAAGSAAKPTTGKAKAGAGEES